MKLPPKEITCDCGHVFVCEKPKNWCIKCGKPVFYEKKDQIKHKWNHRYMIALMLAVITFITYIFLEMIVTPMMGG